MNQQQIGVFTTKILYEINQHASDDNSIFSLFTYLKPYLNEPIYIQLLYPKKLKEYFIRKHLKFSVELILGTLVAIDQSPYYLIKQFNETYHIEEKKTVLYVINEMSILRNQLLQYYMIIKDKSFELIKDIESNMAARSVLYYETNLVNQLINNGIIAHAEGNMILKICRKALHQLN